MIFQGYMRATVFTAKRATFPAYVQPKHNGIRCLWDGETAWTREGNLHKSHIQKWMRERYDPNYLGDWVPDGELILPRDEFSFQQTQSAVTGEDSENAHLLQFLVFDCHNKRIDGPIFPERLTEGIITCPTYKAESLKVVEYWYDAFLEMGYEGLIFRTDTPYLFGSAGRHLMKKKPVKHAEFICIGVWEGTGKFVGVPTYRLNRPDVPYIHGAPATTKNSFGAVPIGDMGEKKALWLKHKDGSCIGKLYSIECADFYDSGVPQFPIGIGVRDYE